jgi:glutamate formiminotransferase
MALIECVPNVSEGQRQSVIEAIATGVRAVPGVRLLDYSADRSHHRSVFTFAGTAPVVRDAVIALAETAVAAIDLRRHHGVHPRLGAVDVVPFVPLEDTPMAVCIALAREVGQLLAARFDLPVYLYEEAAFRPERRRLEDIRRGGFEALAARMTQPDWTPDFGPSRPHPTAGATVVGARPFLIAFNITLRTDRVDVAQRIAAAIRERDGGMAHVKALGLLVDGQAQVSINLTDFRQTPLQEVVDRVALLAATWDVAPAESELIGLIPAAALAGTTPERLGLRDFSPDRIVETRLRTTAADR